MDPLDELFRDAKNGVKALSPRRKAVLALELAGITLALARWKYKRIPRRLLSAITVLHIVLRDNDDKPYL